MLARIAGLLRLSVRILFAAFIVVMGCGYSYSCRKRLRRLVADSSSSQERSGPTSDRASRRAARDRWSEAGVEETELVVRAMSGDTVFTFEAATSDTPVCEIVEGVCGKTGSRCDEVQLCAGLDILHHQVCLGECVVPESCGTLEVMFVKLPGPPVSAEAMSGRAVKVLDTVPVIGERCHLDRDYRFTSLGYFSGKPNVKYLLTSNNDKSTGKRHVMWKLDVRVPAIVYLNFRSQAHVTKAGNWLEAGGWESSTVASTVSTGVPNGPYRGPVYSKEVGNEFVHLMGSSCEEGTYFVFIEISQ